MMTLIFFGSLAFDSILPTLHQYVTNPTRSDTTNGTLAQNYEDYPGFEESELFYSLTITAYSVGSIISSPFIGFLTLCLPYISILLAGVLMHTTSNLLYGLASQGWMILIARVLLGASFKFFKIGALTYIGNRESDYITAYTQHHSKAINEQEAEKKENMVEVEDIQIKKTGVILICLCTFLPALFGPGISSVIAQIPSANLFRWLGYFNAICGVFLLVLVLALFHGEYKISRKKTNGKACNCQSITTTGMKTTRITVLIFLLFAYCVWKVGIEILFTLFSPMLSDNFGLSAKETSYYFTVLWIVYSLGSFFFLIINNVFKTFHIRIAYIGVFIVFIVGASLIADWHTFGEDACQIFSPFRYKDLNNKSISCEEYTSPTLYGYCVEMQMAAESSNWTLQASELCQATRGCHWNQFSVFTDSLCTNCPAICRGVHKSLSIIQYSVGALLFVLAIPAGDICVWILVSNNLQSHEQGPFIGIANGVAGVVGTVSPIWIDALYEMFHKRTVAPMAVYIILCTIVLTGQFVLYRVLDPRDSKGKVNIKNEEEERSLLENSNNSYYLIN